MRSRGWVIGVLGAGLLVAVLLAGAGATRRLLFACVPAALLTAAAGAVLARRARAAREVLEAELRRSRTLMKTVLDHLDAAVYVMDLEGRMLFLNRECARTMGGSPEAITGRSLREIFSPEHAQLVLDNNIRVHSAGKAVELEEAVRSVDGDRVYLSRKAPLAAELYPFPVICGVSTDITALKSYENRLEEVNRDLEAFTYSVSHDLRAPLRAVDGFARILVEDHGPALDAEARRLLGLMQASAKRMGELIDDLLAFSLLGRQELRRAGVNMAALARLAAEEAAADEPQRRVNLSIAPLPAATGDPGMLAQVWRNLLANAYKYTRGRATAAVEVGARSQGGGVEYWVRDDGAGFDPRYARKLFDAFFRLHSAEEFEGTGVGLALVKRVVERHGGRVSAEGAPGRGATFRFYLPREAA